MYRFLSGLLSGPAGANRQGPGPTSTVGTFASVLSRSGQNRTRRCAPQELRGTPGEVPGGRDALLETSALPHMSRKSNASSSKKPASGSWLVS